MIPPELRQLKTAPIGTEFQLHDDGQDRDVAVLKRADDLYELRLGIVTKEQLKHLRNLLKMDDRSTAYNHTVSRVGDGCKFTFNDPYFIFILYEPLCAVLGMPQSLAARIKTPHPDQ